MPIVFQGSSGLNTRHDPFRLAISPEGEMAIKPLGKAVNVLVDDLSGVSRVKGFSLAAAGSYRDLFCDGGECLVVRDDRLCLVNADLSLTELVDLTVPDHVSYVQTDQWNRIYWSNGVDSGFVENGVNHSWTTEGIDQYQRKYPDRMLMDPPPAGHFLAYLNGRLYVASGNTVWISERFFPGLFWAGGRHLHFSTNIQMIGAVADGLWISDERYIYWIGGVAPAGQTQIRKAGYPAVKGSPVKIDADSLNNENLMGAGIVLIFASARGLCLAGPGGFFMNETMHVLESEKSPWPFDASRWAGGVFEKHIFYSFTE